MGRRGSNSPVYYVGIVTILFVVFAAAIASWNYIAPNFGLSGIQVGTQPPGQDTGNLVSVTKPLTVSVRDAQSGTLISGAAVTLLDSNQRILESLITGATGTATSAVPYASGTKIIFAKSAAGYVTEYSSKPVPSMSKMDAESLSSVLIAETMTRTPNVVITVTDRNGNTISSGSSFNMSGLTSAQFTVNVINTLDNSGWKTSYDPINKVNLGMAAVAVPEKDVVLTGSGTLVNRGAVSHLVTPIPDAQITKTVVGSQVSGGSYSYTFTVNRGTLASGTDANVSINVLGYFDQSYYSSFGIGGPLVETLASFTFTVQG
ncbi:MAG: hypothetical protein ABC585_05695 [Candidatus Methanosuratincola petrocarbonis]